MATTFLEPGGDATFNVATTTAGGFWASAVTPVVATDFVHGNHVKSIKYAGGAIDACRTPDGVVADTGGRVSFYLFINALPGTDCTIAAIQTAGGAANVLRIRVTTAGVLQLFEASVQIGSNGSTLSTGQWYRISLAYTITDTTHNRFEVFVNGLSSISVTNATITNTSSSAFRIGNITGAATIDIRSSDHYIDNSSSLADTGNVWVTAKRPNANGITNGFLVQIGAGGSGYGTGHSPQVNERALSTTNGWRTALTSTTEEYTIESASTGDIDITGATIVDYVGWVDAGSTTSVTASIVVGGSASNISVTSTITMFTKAKGSTTYPGGGTDIGMISSGSAGTESLYECGIMIAYIPAAASSSHLLPVMGVGT